MRKQLIITAGAIVAMLAIITPAFAQVPCGIPGGLGFGAPLGSFGPGPVGCGIGLPFGLGGFGVGLPFGNIVALGLSMIDSVLSAAFGCIGLGGLGGWGLPFGGCGW
jgi:hypothetical protein